MSKRILVLKNQGTLELESHEWMELHIYNYQRITIDKKNTYLLKEPDKDSFYSLNEKILDIDGAIVFVLNSPPDVIREILEILKTQQIPYVLLMEESDKEISKTENEVFAIDNSIESLILALNKLSSLIDTNNKKLNGLTLDKKPEINSKPTLSKKEVLEKYALKKTDYIEHKSSESIKNEEIDEEDEISNLNNLNNLKNLEKLDKINLKHNPHDLNQNNILNEEKNEEKEKLKKIKFYLHPIMMNEVKCSLERLGFSNITITDIKYLDAEKKNETYRGGHYNTGLSPRLEAWIVVREGEVSYIMDTIAQLKNEDIDENALISDIEEVIRISSLERGNLAID